MCVSSGHFKFPPNHFPQRSHPLWFPVIVMVLRGDDDHHGEDGAQHDGRDAHRQADEGEVPRLAGGYLCRHHVAAGDSRAHLQGGGDSVDTEGEVGVCGKEQELDRLLCNRQDAGVGASLKTQLKKKKQIDVAALHRSKPADPVRGKRGPAWQRAQAGPVAPRPVSSTQLNAG